VTVDFARIALFYGPPIAILVAATLSYGLRGRQYHRLVLSTQQKDATAQDKKVNSEKPRSLSWRVAELTTLMLSLAYLGDVFLGDATKQSSLSLFGYVLEMPRELILIYMGAAFLLGGLVVWIAELRHRRRARNSERRLRQLEMQIEQTKSRVSQ
jgi:uncharacterized integral membrane protein